MRCPKCSSERSSVIDSRGDGDAIRRRRECQGCQYRFSTYERVEFTSPLVVKKDGSREPFDRLKIRAGLVKACEKRPVSVETIEHAVEAIERSVNERCVKEVSSLSLGELVMDQLRAIDKIAYIRFASVYREFSDVSQFVEALNTLNDPAALAKATPSDPAVPPSTTLPGASGGLD